MVKKNPRLKQEAEKILSKVPEDKVFWCHDSCVFHDMQELASGLATMSDETFAYHCNDEKKDFSSWVKDVIGDEKLARDLGRAPTRTQAVTIVANRVALLTRQL